MALVCIIFEEIANNLVCLKVNADTSKIFPNEMLFLKSKRSRLAFCQMLRLLTLLFRFCNGEGGLQPGRVELSPS